jgi:hypothetical protein
LIAGGEDFDASSGVLVARVRLTRLTSTTSSEMSNQ